MVTEDRNNVTVFPDRAAIKQEAGLWIVRMDEKPLDQEERKALQDWIRQSDFHRDCLMKLAANWDSMAIMKALAEMFPLPDKEPERQRAVANIWLPARWAWSGAMAFGLCAMLALGFLLFGRVFQDDGNRELATAVGERTRYTLEDGTVVFLNTDTRIKVNYGEDRRAIVLVQGEASFDVAKNPEKPFVVYAGNGLVWAVGTVFNVRYLGDAVDVLVTEGRVKVFSGTQTDNDNKSLVAASLQSAHAGADGAPPVTADHSAEEIESQEALIEAGQELRYTAVIETLDFIKEEDFERKLAWRTGSLIFKGETLREAIAEISRYTDEEFIIEDPELEKLRVGGHYKTDDIRLLLDSLGQVLGLDVEYADHGRIVLSAKSSG